MEQYIDKDAIAAEINRRLEVLSKDRDFNYLQIKELKALLSFLDTLEVKEVDFERELSKYVSQGIHRFFPNEGNDYYNIDSVEWQDYVIDTAKHFFDLGLKAQKGE